MLFRSLGRANGGPDVPDDAARKRNVPLALQPSPTWNVRHSPSPFIQSSLAIASHEFMTDLNSLGDLGDVSAFALRIERIIEARLFEVAICRSQALVSIGRHRRHWSR